MATTLLKKKQRKKWLQANFYPHLCCLHHRHIFMVNYQLQTKLPFKTELSILLWQLVFFICIYRCILMNNIKFKASLSHSCFAIMNTVHEEKLLCVVNIIYLLLIKNMEIAEIDQHPSLMDQKVKNQFSKSCFWPGTVRSFIWCTQETIGSRVKHMWL